MEEGRTVLDNYYRIKNHIRRCIQKKSEGHFEFCSLCFEVECDHNLKTDHYDDVLSQLNWWADIAKREAIHSAEAIIVVDALVPYWPFPYREEEADDVDYVIRRAYDLDLVGVANNGDLSASINDKGEVLPIDVDIDNEGITWGYITDEGFYPLATYNEGWIPNDVFSESPNNSGVIGFWHIPQVTSHFYFSKWVAMSRK